MAQPTSAPIGHRMSKFQNGMINNPNAAEDPFGTMNTW